MTAGLTAGPRHNDRCIGMVRKGRAKCRRGVAVVTFYRNAWVASRIGIGAGPDRNYAVVTRRTRRGDR
jgi:hypothetical protein